MIKLPQTIILSTVTAFLALGQVNASLTIQDLEGMSGNENTVQGYHGISAEELKAIKSKIRPYNNLDLGLRTTPRVMRFRVQNRTYDSYTWTVSDSLFMRGTLVVTDAPVLTAAGVTSLTTFLATEASEAAVAKKKAQIKSAKREIRKMTNKRDDLKDDIKREKAYLKKLQSNQPE